jgi:membrane protease YdiL (CAAX protease family)
MNDEAEAPPFRFRIVPVLTTVLLGLGLPYLAGELVEFARHYSHEYVPPIADKLGRLYADHGVQMVLALIVIAAMKWLVPADYGLHAPRGKSYVGAAILWGLFFGISIVLVDHMPELIARTAPKLDYPLTTGNVLGWLGFEGVYVGPTEEILFRSLLVTFLTATMPGKIRLGRYDMNAAGVVVAVIFAFAHLGSFLDSPWWMALAQQIYAFAVGVLYAYWLEKSKSVLAPVISHNVADGTAYALLFLMVAYLR